MTRFRLRLLLFQMMSCLWQPSSCSLGRPVIGIMTQELPSRDRTPEYSSFISINYVNAVECSGAKVVPIFINQTENYYEDLLHKINGVLVPGGSADFLEKGGIGPSTEIILSVAKKLNKAKHHFPILGICWGFQLFLYLTNQKKSLMMQCDLKNITLPLEFNHKTKSKIFKWMPKSINTIFTTQSVTYNSHKWCVTEKNFSHYHMHKEWRALTFSTYKIRAGSKKHHVKFVSAIESRGFPFVGVQFHPEATAFNWRHWPMPHFQEALHVSRYFYDWLVIQAAINDHSFPSPEEEHRSLIWNYQPSFAKTKPSELPVERHYLFK